MTINLVPGKLYRALVPMLSLDGRGGEIVMFLNYSGKWYAEFLYKDQVVSVFHAGVHLDSWFEGPL